MIGSIKILDAINDLLVQKYPNHTVYIDLCPEKFERPSFLLEVSTVDQRPVNRSTIQETVYLTITCFDTIDDYSRSDTVELLTVQQGVMDMFRGGYLKVENRAIGVKASSGGRDFDRAYIDLQFEYCEDRTEAVSNTPRINKVYVTIKEE